MTPVDPVCEPENCTTPLFSPLVARTRAHHHPIDPIAFDCLKVIVIRSGSSLLFSEFGTRRVRVGDVVLLAAHTLCGAEPEGHVTTTTIYLVNRPRFRSVLEARMELDEQEVFAGDA